MNPKVSIIIATYNAAKTLRTALESVAQQAFHEWECIVVDGASKDDTVDIVKEYQSMSPRFRYVSEPDNGVYDAFNKGWRMAEGEWIYYLGSDDRLTKDGLRFLCENSSNYDVVVGHYYGIHGENKVSLYTPQSIPTCHQAIIVKRSVIEFIGGFDTSYKIIADYDMMLTLRMGNFKVRYECKPIAFFASGGMSQSMANKYRIYKERYAIYQKHGITNPRLQSLRILLFAYIKCMTSPIRNIFRPCINNLNLE